MTHHALPADPTPDAGPYHRCDMLVVLASLIGTLASIAGFALLRQHTTIPALAWAPASIVGALSLWGWWCVIQGLRDTTKDKLPRSHSLLVGHLGFDLVCTSRGVAATAFICPDTLAPGATSKLLIFFENYASRQRLVHTRISHHPDLGLPDRQYPKFHLAAGQAAVYVFPFRASTGIKPGYHQLPVCIHVTRPNGRGLRLPDSRRHLYDIRSVRFAAPLLIEGTPLPPDTTPLPAPEFITLARVTDKEPRFDALETLLPSSTR
ncbi:hypothetical protein [Geminisphaera colitermitum]|uniref:hypothetical protein n=1 Tax=Geminisphaera colitermitum TaxID=1148786 RepID=UPI0001965047|nr:hypothetical protein [Geminisphaera colitermitum]